MTERRRSPRCSRALALEPRILLDAAVTATAEAVVTATDTKPGVSANSVAATVTVDDSSGAQAVDLFSDVSVSLDSGSETLDSLVITVDSSGSNQALVIDGSTITLEADSGETANNGYYYTVTVSGGTTTITVSIASSDAYSSTDVASLIDGISYSTLDNTVESGTVTVTLSTLSDDSDTATLDISSTITIDSNINVAPTLSDDNALESAETFTIDDLGDDAQVAYSSDGDYAYVAGDGSLSVFSVDDSGRLTLVETVSVDDMSSATEMVVSSDGNSIYVVDGSSSIYVFSVADDGTVSLSDTVSSSNGLITGGLAISDDGSYVYVGTQYNDVAIFSRDTATGALTYLTRAPGESGSSSRNGVIATTDDYVYVIYTTGSHSILVYEQNDDGSLTKVATLTTSVSGYSAVDYSLAVSDDGQTLYVADPVNGTVAVYRFSGDSLSLLETLSLDGVSSIALSSDGSLLYATTDSGDINVYAVSSSGSLSLISSVEAGTGISDIAVSDDGLSLLVTGSDGSVSRYSLAQTLDQGSAVAFASGVTLTDSNYDTLNDGNGNYAGATITVSASVSGGSFSFADGNGLSYASGTISYNGSAIATVSTSSDGVLSVSFTSQVSTEVANQVLQQLTYSNGSASVGSYITLSVSVSDATLTSTVLTITLRLNAVPQLDDDAATGYTLGTTTSETWYSYTLYSGLFSDADGDSLSWSVSGLPAGLSFDAETLTISGYATETGSFSVTVSVTDVSGASATLELTLVVDQIANRAPELNSDVSTTLASATESSAYSVTLDSSLFSDADSIYGDSLSWSVTGLPTGFSFDTETLTITGSSSVVGDYTFTVTVTDSSGATATVELTLRVITVEEASNSAPSVGGDDSALTYTAEGGISGYSYYVQSLVLSDDDGTLVVVGNTAANYSLTATGTAYLSIYSRDSETGELTLVQTFVQGTSDDGNDANGIDIDGLGGATSAIYSADGQYLYVTGQNAAGEYVITVFSVNDDGSLSATGLSVVTGSAQLKSITVSEDGSTVYAVSASSVYSLNVGDDGSLTLVGTYTAASGNTYGIEVDSNGYVYVLSGNYISVYAANADSTLTLLVSQSGLGLSTYARSFAVGDDGYIYVATGTGGTVVTIYYDSDSNTLTKVSSVSVSQAWGVSLSADGTTLYVGNSSGSFLIYSIGDDGSLTYVKTVSSIGARAYRVAISSDGSSIYTGGFFTSAGLALISTTETVAMSYTEGGSALIGSSLTVSDADYDALNDGAGNYNTASITIARDGGADSADSYGFVDGNGLSLVDGVIYYDGTEIATFTSSGGTLTIAFTSDAVTTAIANLVLQQISYSNSSDNPGSSITLVVSVSDQYTSNSTSVLLSVTEVNDAPTLGSSAITATYVTGAGSGVRLFDDTVISTVESGQTITSLTLTVAGVSDGANETLTIDGTAVALIAGSGTTSNGYSYTVTVSGDTVTVTLTSSSGIATDAAAALIDAITYANSSDDPSGDSRTVTLTAIKDSGGTSNGGSDTTTLSVSASVTLSSQNSAPTASSSAASTTYVENGDAASLFSETEISTVEGGQSIASLSFTVSGVSDGASETLTIDGTAIALVEGSGTTSSGYSYTVSVDADTGLVTLTLSSSDGIAAADAAALIDASRYANASEEPTEGDRIITLTALQDDGGTGNSGSDTSTLDIAATVSVVAVNDAPTLDATAATVTYSERGTAATLFSGVSIDTVESAQTITSVTLTVSGVSDGTSETLSIDGTRVALVAGSGTTDSGYSYTVTVDADTGLVTVTLTSSDGIAAADAAALISAITYTNSSSTSTAGERSFGLSVQDSGGTDGGGSDSAALADSASVVLAVNSAPVLGSSTPDNENLEIVETLASVSGLSDVSATVLSSDGAYLYAISSDGAVAIFSCSSSGELTWLETIASGLDDAIDIQISSDGDTLYVLGEGGDAIAVFSVSSNGSLTLTQTLTTENATAFAVAEDGSAIYVVDGNYSGLKVYTLNGDSGEYVLSQSIAASTSSEPYLFTGVGIVVSGDYVYVITDPASSALASTLIVYQVGESGTLTAVAYLQDGATDGEGNTVSLSDAQSVVVASDGATIYVASDDSVAIFSFDAGSGTLTYAGTISGLSGITNLVLASDGDTLYVVSSDGSISRYDVSGDSAVLLQTVTSDSLAGASDVSVASNGAVVVAGSSGLVNLRDGLADSVPASYTEGSSTLIASGLTLSDADYDALNDGAGNYNGASISVVRDGGSDSSDSYGFVDGNGLTLTNGVIYYDGTAIASFAVEDGTLTITFTSDAVTTEVANWVLQQISYSNGNDDPGSSISLALSVTDAYDETASVVLVLAVAEVNDAPTLNSTAGSVGYTENGTAVTLFSGTSIDTIEAGQSIGNLMLTVAGVSDGDSETLTIDGTAIALIAGSGSTSSGYSYTVTVDADSGLVTVTISSGDGIAAADAAALIDAIAYANADDDPTEGQRTVTLVSISDDGGSDNGGSDTTSLAIATTISITAVNDAPTLNAPAAAVTYSEGGGAATLFSGTVIDTIEAGQTITSLTLTVAGASDVGSASDSETLTIDGTTIALVAGSGSTSSGYGYSVTVDADGLVTVTISFDGDGIAAADAAALIDAIAYANATSNPTAGERIVTLSLTDSGGSDNDGDNVSSAISASVTVAIINDAPELNSTAATLTYTEGDTSSDSLFDGTAIDTIEAGQSISSVTLTVAGVADGGSETLTIDGTAIALVAGSGTTRSGYDYVVSVDASSGLVTVTISSSEGIAAADAAALIDAIAYANGSDDPTAGTRTVTLTAIQDDGGSGNDGADTATLDIAATVTVVAVNDAPTIASTAASASVSLAHADGGTALFSGTSIDTVESGQTIATITLTVTGVADGANETLTIDGTSIALVAGSGTTSGGYGYTVSVAADGVVTVTIIGGSGIAAADAATLIDGIIYADASADPTLGTRSVTLSIQDDGGAANGGSDSAMLANSATLAIVNSAPQYSGLPYGLETATTDVAYAASLASDLFSDADGDTLTWSVSGLPDGLSFDAATRTISGSVATAGNYTLTVTVTDPSGASATLTLTLNVQAASSSSDAAPAGLPSSYFNSNRFDAITAGEDVGTPEERVPELFAPARAATPALFASLGASMPSAVPQPGYETASAPLTAHATLELLNALDVRREAESAAALQLADGRITPLVSLAAPDGPALAASVDALHGRWQTDVAGNRQIFALPAGLFVSREPIAALTLRLADGRPLPANLRLDVERGLVVRSGLQGSDGALRLTLQIRTVDGHVLAIPLTLDGPVRPAVPAGGDASERPHAQEAGKEALSLQLREHAARDLFAQAQAFLASLGDHSAATSSHPSSGSARDAAPAVHVSTVSAES